MPGLRDVRQDQAVAAFLRLGGTERATKKNYRMVTMPNGSLLAVPSGVLKIGTLRALIRYAGLTPSDFEEALQ
jgi:hypothetical protein